MSILRATSYVRARFLTEAPAESLVLESQDRHIRRKLLRTENGGQLLVDLPKAVQLEDRDCLVLDDGRLVQVMAADEDLTEITATSPEHLVRLAWHIGNRHLEAQIESHRILIRPDHVIVHMLENLGARTSTVRERFTPEHGAYSHGTHAHAASQPDLSHDAQHGH